MEKQPPPGCRLATDGPFKGKYIVDDIDELQRSRFSPVLQNMVAGHCVWCGHMMITYEGYEHIKCGECGERHRKESLDGSGLIWRPDPEPRDGA